MRRPTITLRKKRLALHVERLEERNAPTPTNTGGFDFAQTMPPPLS